jgi:hypothetical protein
LRNNALRRAVGAGVVLTAACLLLGNGMIGSTFALFNGQTQNANSAFAGGWVGAPSAATATAVGYDMSLAWTPGTHGPVTGQELYGVDNGANSNCTGAAYSVSPLATMATAATATYTDASRGTAANNGNWYCYKLLSTSATSWTAPFALAGTQLGLVTTAVQIANATGANRIERNDVITLNFNQRTNLAAGTIKVCAYTSGTVLVGDSAGGAGCNVDTDTYSVAKLKVTGATIPSVIAFRTSTLAVSSTAPWTATITLSGTASTVTMSGTPTSWKLTGSPGILSNATTHQATMCSAGTTNCQPTTATNF